MKKMNTSTMRNANGGFRCRCGAEFSNGVTGAFKFLLHKPLCLAWF